MKYILCRINFLKTLIIAYTYSSLIILIRQFVSFNVYLIKIPRYCIPIAMSDIERSAEKFCKIIWFLT